MKTPWENLPGGKHLQQLGKIRRENTLPAWNRQRPFCKKCPSDVCPYPWSSYLLSQTLESKTERWGQGEALPLGSTLFPPAWEPKSTALNTLTRKVVANASGFPSRAHSHSLPRAGRFNLSLDRKPGECCWRPMQLERHFWRIIQNPTLLTTLNIQSVHRHIF